MAQQSLQQMQPGFNVFQQNERLQPQISMLSGIDGAPQLPDFSITNQFGGNPFQRASGMLGLGGGGNPFGMSAGAALAASALPSFGGGVAGSGGGGGGAAGALNAAAQKIAASSDKLVAALDKLTAALGGGGPGSGPGAPGMPSGPGRPGASPLMSRLGMGIGATFAAGLSAYNFGTYQIGLEANAMAAQNAEVFFNQGLGGLGNNYRGYNLRQQITAAQRDSMGNTVQSAGIGMMALGGIASLGAVFAAPFTGGTSLSALPYTIGLAAAGGGVAGGGSAITSRAGEEARRNAEDRNSAVYREGLAKDIALQNARRSASVGAAFTLSSYYNALANNPGGEGTAAVYRAGRYARTAARASALSSMGDMVIPFEQQGFNFLNNVSMNSGRFNDIANGGFFQRQDGFTQLRFGGVAGKDPKGRLIYESGLFGGTIRGNMTDYTGQMTQALGLTNMQAMNELNAIVSAQGFRGIGADFFNGRTTLAGQAHTQPGNTQSLQQIIKNKGASAFIRTPEARNAGLGLDRDESQMMPLLRRQAGMRPDNQVATAGARLMGGLNAVYTNYESIGDINTMAAQISGINDPRYLLRSPNNIQTTMSEIIRARQLGFSAQTIGLMARTGQGGLGTQAFLSTRQLTGETEFLGLRGAGAQAYIQGRSGFLENFANRGINLLATESDVPGFASASLARIRMRSEAAIGRNPSTFTQPGFGVNNVGGDVASNQLLGEIATVMNRGRANMMQSFMGAQYGNRANEMMMGNANVESRLRGVLGGFGEEILFSHFLAASGGNVEQAIRMAQTAGPLTKRNIIAGVGGGDKAFTREGLISMGMSPDTASVIANAPNVLESLPQKERELLRNAMSGSAAAAKGESEVQVMARFHRTNYRIMKISEAMKIAMEGSALDIAEILRFLKSRFGSGGGGGRTKPKPAPSPDPYNFDEMTQEEIDAISDEEDIDADPGI